MLDIFRLEKAVISIYSTDAGTKHDVKDEQNEKTESSIRSQLNPIRKKQQKETGNPQNIVCIEFQPKKGCKWI
jgi:hypothetical protein